MQVNNNQNSINLDELKKNILQGLDVYAKEKNKLTEEQLDSVIQKSSSVLNQKITKKTKEFVERTASKILQNRQNITDIINDIKGALNETLKGQNFSYILISIKQLFEKVQDRQFNKICQNDASESLDDRARRNRVFNTSYLNTAAKQKLLPVEQAEQTKSYVNKMITCISLYIKLSIVENIFEKVILEEFKKLLPRNFNISSMMDHIKKDIPDYADQINTVFPEEQLSSVNITPAGRAGRSRGNNQG
jgi:hypothetical protein